MILTRDKGKRMWGGGSVFGGSGGSGGAGGGGGADGVSIPYYNQNFELLYKQMVTDGTTGTITTSFLTAQPNEVVNTGTETDSESGDVTVTSLVGPRAKNAMVIGDAMLVWDAVNNAIKVVGRDGSTAANLYATGGVSALGYGPGGGGGGATALTDLVDVAVSSPTNGQVLMYNSSTGKWYNGTVQSGGGGTVTSITAGTGLTGGTITASGTIALSQETQTAIAAGVTAYGWGDHAQAGYLKSSALTGYATQQWVQQQGYLTSSAISDMATKTWVNNQGFLTQASGTFWGQAWSNGGTVKGSLAAGSNGGVIEQFHCIELNNAGSLSGYGGYIDFHYNGSSADYTTRLIESEAGVMLIQAKNSASPYSDKVVGLKVGSNVTGGSYVQIGNVQLVFDATNNALKVQKSDGTAANFYATGGVSALGFGSGSGGSIQNLTVTGKLTLGSSVIAGNSLFIARQEDDSDCLYLFNDYENSKINNQRYYYNQYDNVGLLGKDYNYSDTTWWIDPDGCALFQRVYLSNNVYLYTDGSNIKVRIGSTVYTLTKS